MTYTESEVVIEPEVLNETTKHSIAQRLLKLLNSGKLDLDTFETICEELELDCTILDQLES